MSAETLRKAAALMRELAEAAEPGPWVRDGNAVRPGVIQPWRALALTYDDDRHPNAEHIASWHPAVALEAAAWLEAEANRFEAKWGRGPYRMVPGFDEPTPDPWAIGFARTYLGESS